MPHAVPSSSRRERRSSQLTARGQAFPSPTALSHTRLAGLIVRFPALHELKDPPGENLVACYDHPCVILSPVLAADGVVTVLPMTSFGGCNLQKKYPENSHAGKRAHYLPVAPAPAHPDTAELLHLGDPGRMEMRKDSYINTKRAYPGIPFAILQPFHGRHCSGMFLSVNSYQLVIERVGFAAPPVTAPRVAGPELDTLWDLLPSRPVSGQPAGTAGRGATRAPARWNAPRVLWDDGWDCNIDVDRLLEHQAGRHPPPSYGALPMSRPRRRPPVWSTTRGGWEASSSHSGGAAGRCLAPGFATRFLKCVLWASAAFLMGYGVYLGVAKSIEMARLFWAWLMNSVGAMAGAVRGAFRGAHDSITSAEDGVRGAWESVVG